MNGLFTEKEIIFENRADYYSKIDGILEEYNKDLSYVAFRFKNELESEPCITLPNISISPRIIYAEKCHIAPAVYAGNTVEITYISPDLLKGMPNLESVQQFFYNSTISTDVIPEDLFKYNTKLWRFSGIFLNCRNLTSIPSNIFKHFGKLERNYDFLQCFQNTAIASIPEDLFDSFDRIRYLNNCFYGCLSLEYIPEFWNKSFTVDYTVDCFGGCYNATNYLHVPISWGGPTDIDAVFSYIDFNSNAMVGSMFRLVINLDFSNSSFDKYISLKENIIPLDDISIVVKNLDSMKFEIDNRVWNDTTRVLTYTFYAFVPDSVGDQIGYVLYRNTSKELFNFKILPHSGGGGDTHSGGTGGKP